LYNPVPKAFATPTGVETAKNPNNHQKQPEKALKRSFRPKNQLLSPLFSPFGWGNVTGIDVDSIQYAAQKYPSLSFVSCDISDVAHHIQRQFNYRYFVSEYAVADSQQQ